MRCRQCGEPWDLDSLHDELAVVDGAFAPWAVDTVEELRDHWENKSAVMRRPRTDKTTGRTYYHDQAIYSEYFDVMRQRFAEEGCALFGCSHGEPIGPGPRSVIDAVDDLMGSDVDGAESMLEDAEASGLL